MKILTCDLNTIIMSLRIANGVATFSALPGQFSLRNPALVRESAEDKRNLFPALLRTHSLKELRSPRRTGKKAGSERKLCSQTKFFSFVPRRSILQVFLSFSSPDGMSDSVLRPNTRVKLSQCLPPPSPYFPPSLFLAFPSVLNEWFSTSCALHSPKRID